MFLILPLIYLQNSIRFFTGGKFLAMPGKTSSKDYLTFSPVTFDWSLMKGYAYTPVGHYG
ncbi:MAG: hypothetical protein KAI34_05325 [Candidatus Lokiarchaeota archaeon]|nr:hypothetical protein [Candidatus Lokiarchaeota archaeon]